MGKKQDQRGSEAEAWSGCALIHFLLETHRAWFVSRPEGRAHQPWPMVPAGRLARRRVAGLPAVRFPSPKN